jgi:hypothetical protein
MTDSLINAGPFMRYVPHSAPIEFADDERPFAYLPAMWGGENDGIGGSAPADPLMIYVQLPVNPGDDLSRWPTWSISLVTLVEEVIQGSTNPLIGKISTGDKFGNAAIKIRNALRDLADRLDNAIEQPS